MQPLAHPVMAASLRVLGSLVLDVVTGPSGGGTASTTATPGSSTTLTGTFLTDTGAQLDRFQIVKGPGVGVTARAPCT
jgi:hypothetical protein